MPKVVRPEGQNRRHLTRDEREFASCFQAREYDEAAITLPRSLANSRPSLAVPNSTRCSRSSLTSGGGIGGLLWPTALATW